MRFSRPLVIFTLGYILGYAVASTTAVLAIGYILRKKEGRW